MRIARTWGIVALSLLATAGCSKTAEFPEWISFGRYTLMKATSWNHWRMSGVVYVAREETLPTASLQVGAIISWQHATASDLHAWMAKQSRERAMFAYDSGPGEESCRVGVNTDGRYFLTLQVCQTDIGRSVCVEADETLDRPVFDACVGHQDRLIDLCHEHALDRREALDRFLAEVMAIP